MADGTPTAPQPPSGRGGKSNDGSTPWGSYDIADGLSPTERSQLQIDIDKGVGDRLRQARSIAPSVRQATRAEVINLTMLYERLGNPFSVRRIPFSVLRDMATDPMISFAHYYTRVPLIRADWHINCPDAELAAAVDFALRPVNSDTQVALCQKLSYGFQPICKRFKLGQLDAIYRDPNGDDPEKDLPVWDSNLPALLWDKPRTLAPENCLPRWNERGDFDGFYYSIVPLPNPIQVGIASLYGYTSVPGYEVTTEFAMWATNELLESNMSIYGMPRANRAYRYFWSYWYRWALADRSFENLADPIKYVYFPTDIDQVIDSEDPNIADNPTVQHMRSLALSIGDQMRSGGTVAMPGDFIVDQQGKMTAHRKWEVGYIEPKANFKDFHESFSYLDALKFRCVPADTPIDCPRDHRRYPEGVPISMLKPGDPVWTFNLMTLKFELSPVKMALKTQENQPVFTVSLSNGRQIRATNNHPFLTSDLEWKQLDELVPGDSLVEFRRDFEPYVKLDPTSNSGPRVEEYRELGRWDDDRPEDRGDGSERKDRWEIHHLDAVHANTSQENLQWLRNSEHMVLERTGRVSSAETRRKQSATRIKIKDEIRVAKVAELHASDDALLEQYVGPQECSTDGCSSDAKCRGLCIRCYGNARYQNKVNGIQLPELVDIRARSYSIGECRSCSREFLRRGSRQIQCQACRYELAIEQGRTWRKRMGCVDPETGKVIGTVSSRPIPSFGDTCDSAKVVSIELTGVEDVWDVAIDAPDERKNFISAGVVLHNSWFVPEQAFVSGQMGASGGTGSGGSSRLMGVQLGEVYQQSQQLLADENDAVINEHMIPQFIAANFPEKAGTPCRKVTRGFGAYDSELMKQIIQLVGQVKGSVLPVDIREMLRQAGMPLMSEKQQKQQEQQIAEEAAKMQPTPQPFEKTGMQGYNSGIEKTPQGYSVYIQPPQRIDLATSHEGFLSELPDGVPAYGDASVRASMMRLRKMMLDRYQQQVDALVEHVSSQPSLHLAQQSVQQAPPPPQGAQTQQPQPPPQQGLTASQAAGVAAAIVGGWLTAQAVDETQQNLSLIFFSIAQRAAKRELKLAHLSDDVVDYPALQLWAQQRASFTADSIGSTIRSEMTNFLVDELQRETDPEKVAQAARERFSDTPQTHADRVAKTDGLLSYNQGALLALRDAGVAQVQAHDASGGRDNLTDPECRKRDAEVMSVDEAIKVAADEHPHGTLWFSPLSTDAFRTEVVEMLPTHLNGKPGMVAAFDEKTEILFVLEETDEEQRRDLTLAVGALLQLR